MSGDLKWEGHVAQGVAVETERSYLPVGQEEPDDLALVIDPCRHDRDGAGD